MGNKSLVALAVGTFALGISEFSMMGILVTVANAFSISIPRAGDFISAYALGVSIGAPTLLFLNRFPMKRIMLGLCAIIALGNICVALSPGYYSMLLGRFVSGLPHGVYFGAGAIVATRLASKGQKAAAVSIMVTGMTVANVVGVPLATWVSNAFTWRLAFGLVSVVGCIAFLSIFYLVPVMRSNAEYSKNTTNARIKSQFAFLKTLVPWLIFIGTFLGQGSLYCWFSYIEPIMVHVADFPSSEVTWIMMIAGIGMVTGGLVSGKFADKFSPALVTCVISVLSIPILLLIYFYSENRALSIILTFLGAASIFGIGTPLQYLIVRFAKGGEMLGGAGIQVAFNVSNACAAALGGLAIHHGLGFTSPALVGIPLAIGASCALFYLYHRYRFIGA